MDLFGIISFSIGIAVSLSIAYWQHRKAKAAEEKLDIYLKKLPTEIVDNITRAFRNENPNNNSSEDSIKELKNSNYDSTVKYADVNNDGNEELIIQYPFFVHGYMLQVYGMEEMGFELISELSVDAPFGFEIKDLDSDGRLEVRTVETNRSSGLPYVFGLRDVVWYRLEGNEFKEIYRIEPTIDEINERKKEIEMENM